LLPLELRVAGLQLGRAQAFRNVPEKPVGGHDRIVQEPALNAPLDRDQVARLGGLDIDQRDALHRLHEVGLAFAHRVRVNDVPDNEPRQIVRSVAQGLMPGAVRELERPVGADALDHVRGVVEQRLVTFFTLP